MKNSKIILLALLKVNSFTGTFEEQLEEHLFPFGWLLLRHVHQKCASGKSEKFL